MCACHRAMSFAGNGFMAPRPQGVRVPSGTNGDEGTGRDVAMSAGGLNRRADHEPARSRRGTPPGTAERRPGMRTTHPRQRPGATLTPGAKLVARGVAIGRQGAARRLPDASAGRRYRRNTGRSEDKNWVTIWPSACRPRPYPTPRRSPPRVRRRRGRGARPGRPAPRRGR